MKKISFLSHSVWTCSPEKNSYKKTIFRSFSAADGQMSGQMSIQLTYLNRAFHGLSIDMSHDPEHIFSVFGVVTPPGGVQGGPPSKILSDYKNIGINLCPCQKSASYLKKCGRAPPPTFCWGVSGVVLGVSPPGGSRVLPSQKSFRL